MFFVISGVFWTKSALEILGGIFLIFVAGLGLGVAGAAVINANSAVPNADSLLRSIQDTATLVTEKATYDVYVSSGIIDGFKGANSYSGEFTGTGEIHAGIDFSDMTTENIHYENGVYNIQIPPPKFTTCVLSNFKQISRSATLFLVDWNRLYDLATIDAYNSVTEQGVEGKLLDLAETKAGDVLVNLVSDLTGKNTEITYSQEGRGEKSDPRCTPDFPNGWGKEDLNYNWIKLPS